MRILHLAFWFLTVSALLQAQEEKSERSRFPSPDKKWEFRVIDETAGLLRLGSDTPVVDLGEEIGYLAAETGHLVWNPIRVYSHLTPEKAANTMAASFMNSPAVSGKSCRRWKTTPKLWTR
jgi:hypothetical protein